MDNTICGMLMLFRPEQPENAHLPIDIIVDGITKSEIVVILAKDSSPISVTELGIFVFLHPEINLLVAVSICSLLSYTLLPASTSILVRLLQPLKSGPTIVATELGIVIFVRPIHPSKT